MKYRYKVKCLICNFTDTYIHENKEDYQEVSVCPECNGALVDRYKLSKYLPAESKLPAITNEEREIMQLTADIAIKFKNLEQTHPSDISEVVDAIHRIQDIIACRIARRVVPDVFVTYNNPSVATKGSE